MEDDAIETTQSFSGSSDICQQILNRYAQSSAAQHRHLCATAAATRSIIQSSSLPLTPLSYFAATITSLSNSKSLDSTALAALTSFLSIVLPLVNKGEIKPQKAEEAVMVLVRVVEESGPTLGTSSVRALVKCLGLLVAEFCGDEWHSVSLGLEWLLKFSVDKRPKVRKCAQDCLVMAIKSFGSSTILKKARKLIYSFFKDHMPLALEMAAIRIADEPKSEVILRPEYQEVLHLLNVMKQLIPNLSPKYCTKMLSQLLKILSSHFTAVTRHAFNVILVIIETLGPEVIVSIAEDIFRSLVSYISLGEQNPFDTVLIAATLAKIVEDKLHDGGLKEWTTSFLCLTECLAGLLASKDDLASEASRILRELIDRHIDGKNLETIGSQKMKDKSTQNAELKAMETTCAVFYNVLTGLDQFPNEHLLSVIASLFLKLGEMSDAFMKGIILKLADLMNETQASASEIECLQECVGSAVAAIGPEKLLALLPISFDAANVCCSNSWLIPILKKNIVGSSLMFYIEHIVPLAESLEKASRKVKKSVIRQDLQAYAHECWGLLPAFCRKPRDTYRSFAELEKLLISFVQKDSFMLENICIGLQDLVNENKSALASYSESEKFLEDQRIGITDEFAQDINRRHSDTRKIAKKNMKALASCSKEFLQALTNVFFESPLETRKHLKGAIKCFISICNPSLAKEIFTASLEKFHLLDDIDEHRKVATETNGPADEEVRDAFSDVVSNSKRCLILELASCFVEGSDEDLVNLLFSLIKSGLQATDELGQDEAYRTLSRILEKHSWFCSSHADALMDLLTGLKSSAYTTLLKGRFSCLQALLIDSITRNLDEENTKVFLILNEIILTLKDSDEGGRKAAYDALNGISSKLRNSSDAILEGPYRKLFRMLTGYLSDSSSPHIKSGVVSALSVLVYNDAFICTAMPDLVPSVMELLHSKAIEVIKSVLGFVKVLVSCLEAEELHSLLPDIMDGILRWSSISRHHFKTKVTVILEILIRKCGTARVKGLAPEKYNDFVQRVVMNRHGKSGLKEGGATETGSKSSDLSPGNPKRKRDESVISNQEKVYGRPWKKKKDNKENVGNSDKVGDSGRGKKGKFDKQGGGKWRKSNREFADGKQHQHRDRSIMRNNNNNNEGKIQRSAFSSKHSKPRKVWKKGQKSN